MGNRKGTACLLSFGATLLLSAPPVDIARADEFVVSFENLETALNPKVLFSTGFAQPDKVVFKNGFTQPDTVLYGTSKTDAKLGGWRKTVNWDGDRVKKSGRGANVTVAVLDSLAYCPHEAFSPGQCSNDTAPGGNYVYYGHHGTLVSSLIGGQGKYGVARNSTILNYAIFEDNPFWFPGSDQPTHLYIGDQYVRDSMANAAANGASIANWSFGPLFHTNIFGSDHKLQTINTHRDNILVVQAAGNLDGIITERRTFNFAGNAFKDPLKNLLIVGALNKKGKKIASNSKWGRNRPGNGCLLGSGEFECTKGNKYKHYFIVAPGYVKGAGANNNLDIKNAGTSFAAPLVSGAAALIKSKWQHLTPNQIRQILLKTAKDIGKKGTDKVYGRGVLNIKGALKPINGTVSLSNGKSVSTGKAVPFTALSSTSNLSKSGVKIVDRFQRDFGAVNETAIARNDELVIPAGNGLSKSYVSMAYRDEGYTFDGFSYEDKLSLDLNIAESGIFELLDGGVQHTQVGYLPDMLAQLSTGSTHMAYRFGGSSLFAVMADGDSASPTQPNMFGMTQVKKHSPDASTGLTLAVIEETGRFGVNSTPEFGFNDTTTGLFGEVSHSFQFNRARLTGAVSSTYYHEGIDSAALNSSGFGFASASLKLSYPFDLQGLMRFELGGSTGNIPFGNLQSSVLGLNSLDDIYSTLPKVSAGLSYQFGTDGDFQMVVEQARTETRGAMAFRLGF